MSGPQHKIYSTAVGGAGPGMPGPTTVASLSRLLNTHPQYPPPVQAVLGAQRKLRLWPSFCGTHWAGTARRLPAPALQCQAHSAAQGSFISRIERCAVPVKAVVAAQRAACSIPADMQTLRTAHAPSPARFPAPSGGIELPPAGPGRLHHGVVILACSTKRSSSASRRWYSSGG